MTRVPFHVKSWVEEQRQIAPEDRAPVEESTHLNAADQLEDIPVTPPHEAELPVADKRVVVAKGVARALAPAGVVATVGGILGTIAFISPVTWVLAGLGGLAWAGISEHRRRQKAQHVPVVANSSSSEVSIGPSLLAEAMNRAPNQLEANTVGAARWFKQGDLSGLKGMRDYASHEDTVGSHKLLTDNPLARLGELATGKAIRDVQGDGNCWITSVVYSLLAHCRDNPEFLTDLITKIPHEHPNLEFLEVLQELQESDHRVSDDELMSLITSPAYGKAIQDFIRTIAERRDKDSYGGHDELTRLANYFGVKIKHVSCGVEFSHEEELGGDANPLLSKSIVFIPNKARDKPGHYVVLERQK